MSLTPNKVTNLALFILAVRKLWAMRLAQRQQVLLLGVFALGGLYAPLTPPPPPPPPADLVYVQNQGVHGGRAPPTGHGDGHGRLRRDQGRRVQLHLGQR